MLPSELVTPDVDIKISRIPIVQVYIIYYFELRVAVSYELNVLVFVGKLDIHTYIKGKKAT